MLYTVANEGWTAGSPLRPSADRPGLYRTRAGAAEVAAGRPLLVVSVRYDALRSLVISQDLGCLAPGGLWTAPAIVDHRGVVTVLATIPARLIRLVAPAEIRLDPATASPYPRPRTIGPSTSGASGGLLHLKARRFLQGSASRTDRGGRSDPSG